MDRRDRNRKKSRNRCTGLGRRVNSW